MNRKIIADTRRHVMKWCACNDGTGFCRARDMPCVQITIFENHQEGEPLRFCRYFREAVLPLNPFLESQIRSGKPDGMAHCKTCGRPISKASNRQLYCPECAISERRRKVAKNARNFRAKQK